jgi:hypothetical protein
MYRWLVPIRRSPHVLRPIIVRPPLTPTSSYHTNHYFYYLDSPWATYATHPAPLRHTTNQTKFNQILFLIGLTLIIGVQKTVVFFTRPQKLKGTAAFTAGIILILLRWPLTGFLIELYGLFILFGDFLVTIGQFAGNIPVIGPYIKRGLEVLAGGRSNAELPV